MKTALEKNKSVGKSSDEKLLLNNLNDLMKNETANFNSDTVFTWNY
jgi:hypothetical protein